jgi:hypothetical protein
MLLNLLASGITGQFTDYSSYIENYFSPALPQSGDPSVSQQNPRHTLFTWLAAKVGRKAD